VVGSLGELDARAFSLDPGTPDAGDYSRALCLGGTYNRGWRCSARSAGDYRLGAFLPATL